MSFTVLVPARLASSRLPGKPLADTRAFIEKFRAQDAFGPLPPIIVAALRKRMVALSGELAQGVVFANAARSHMAQSLDALPAAKRNDPAFFIGNMIPTCINDDVDAARQVLDKYPPVDLTPHINEKNRALDLLMTVDEDLHTLRTKLKEKVDNRSTLEAHQKECVRRYESAKERIKEYEEDLKKLAFNNNLLKKMRGLKPAITDHLWNTVLSAVSNFFSQLRGENSVVSKDNGGFKVNGKGIESLSGSTLDVLALSVRVALTKTFIPHMSFMALDEPAHGCDNDRTASMLGFLSSVGFNQILVASHDELSEAVADSVINLGV